MDANEKPNEAKSKFVAGAQEVKNKISLLPFRRLAEAKVPAATREKFPILNKLVPMANFIVCGLAVLLVVAIISNVGGGNRQRHCPEDHFNARPIAGGAGVEITGYTGGSWEVRIPPRIQGLPVTKIGNNAFRDRNLISVTIPSSVTHIGEGAFYGNQLTSVTIPNSVTTIEHSAFRNNQLTSVTIPNSVTTIEPSVFRNNQLTSVTIPSSVTSIWHEAFYNNQLTSVTIPSSVTNIEEGAFYNNQLTSITIGANLDLVAVSGYGFSGSFFYRRTATFSNNFVVFYNNNGRRAGTYTWDGRTWTLRDDIAMAAEQAFLAENARRRGIRVTSSGLQYEVLEQGSGQRPLATSMVRVHYEIRLVDGTVVDSSFIRGEPTEFPIAGVIPGWTEGLQLMTVGSRYRFYIPSELAYGPSGVGPIPGFAIGNL